MSARYRWVLPALWAACFVVSWYNPGAEMTALLMGASPAIWWSSLDVCGSPAVCFVLTLMTGTALSCGIGVILERTRVGAVTYCSLFFVISFLAAMLLWESSSLVARLSAGGLLAVNAAGVCALMIECARRWFGMVGREIA